MIISIWIPIVLSVLAIAYILSPISKFIFGWKDEGFAIMIAGTAWLLYILDISIENFINKLVSGDITTIVFTFIIIIIISIYLKMRTKK